MSISGRRAQRLHAPDRGIRGPACARTGVGLASVLAASLAFAGAAQAAAAPVTLGTDANFSVLSGQSITNTGQTTMAKDLGLDPGSSVTGAPMTLGTMHVNDGVAIQAKSDLVTAINDAAGRPATVLSSTDLSGQAFTPGVYSASSTLLFSAGQVTLNAQGDPNAVFIFQVGSSMTTGSATSVLLTNGAQPCNVFWEIHDSATLGSGSTFVGTVMAQTSITAGSSATLDGRLLASTGSLTLHNNTITTSACATPPAAAVRPPRWYADHRRDRTPTTRRHAHERHAGSRGHPGPDPGRLKQHLEQEAARRAAQGAPSGRCTQGQPDPAPARPAPGASASRAGPRPSAAFPGPGADRLRRFHGMNAHRAAAPRPQPRTASSRTGAWHRSVGSVWALAAVVIACVAGGAIAPAVAGARSLVTPDQALVRLRFAHQVYATPGTGRPLARWLPARTPLTGATTTLPVVGHAQSDGHRWLRVMLPGRPNSATGWIQAGGTQASETGWRISVSLGRRQVRVYFIGHLLKTFAAVVGKPSTPTPTGRFFVEETEVMPSTAPGGPFVLALSARSNVLQDFDGGPGQIGIHGRDLLGGTLGQAESHGCMRLATSDITWLADRIGPGVPVTIRG